MPDSRSPDRPWLVEKPGSTSSAQNKEEFASDEGGAESLGGPRDVTLRPSAVHEEEEEEEEAKPVAAEERHADPGTGQMHFISTSFSLDDPL
jgi:hypothetical protein